LGVTVGGMLGLRPVNVPPEHSRVNDLRADAPNYFFSNRYQDVWRPLLRDLILGRIDAQISEAAGDPDELIAVIKEPHGSQGADVLLSALPRSRLIFLLRDGRDVVDSALDATTSRSWGVKHLLAGFESAELDRSAFIRDRAHDWLWKTEIVQRAFREHHPDLRRLIRYEDLLDDTEAVLAELTQWIGLEMESEDIRTLVRRLEFGQIPPHRRGPGQFARAATPGLWKENLSPDEQQLLESIIGPKLRECGYR
jgi:hypothetical protein